MRTTLSRAEARGLSTRATVIDAICGARMRRAIRDLRLGAAGAVLNNFLDASVARGILRDLKTDAGWSEECWLLERESAGVVPVTADAFGSAHWSIRFSRNDCLRRPSETAFALRGFLSALLSAEVRESLSAAFGEPLKFRSADMARYSSRHYLRRHSDEFEHRRLGIVWFLAGGWRAGYGGELVIESESGEAMVARPLQGTVALLAIREGCHHQVASIAGPSWVRYSVASHFAAAVPDISGT